MADCLLFV